MTKAPDKRCGTCRWLRLGKDPVTGRYDRVNPRHSYLCDWPIPWFESPILAVSVVSSSPVYSIQRVWSGSGTDCPVWEPRPKPAKPA